MLSVQQVEAGYGESIILRNVSIRVQPGQVVCLLGRNGVGKTTLMKSIIGLLKTAKGSIRFNEVDLTRKLPSERARSGIGYVPQGREVFPQLSVYDNILLGLEASREKTRPSSIPPEAVINFPVLKEMYERRGGDLSGGQQQQLAFARALASKPRLLLLDEPTEGIQPSIVEDIREVIRTIKRDGQMAILLVEQSLDFVKDIGDYFYVMEKGTIVSEGDISELNDQVIRKHLTV
ncbi:urea ABC transporter ATP-binding subunit UrtE [Paenibacillus sp. FSL H7-0326]|uniref:urea ABC transporter ATP-binding subunit UrtE n=1 Tax=Paenibacillus sp. FSL H7-0326 TaxID=1921144 RepID=UPI00096D4D69|nr:urea ABC transporter ATP-binding subunit UrtE [Paenibacillus sp. FSL H7-0326]OMC71406.1 urea ABC transporter ATP-binding subunit UrtE [Paenibacillus sp. FSL H7-0326]